MLRRVPMDLKIIMEGKNKGIVKLGVELLTQRQVTHRPWLQRTHNLMKNVLSKHITSIPQTVAKHLSCAIKHHAGSRTRQYIIIDHLSILHESSCTAQLWAESISMAVGWGDMPSAHASATVFIMLPSSSWAGLSLTDLPERSREASDQYGVSQTAGNHKRWLRGAVRRGRRGWRGG